MNWESFYDGFYGWSDAAQKKISQMQTDFGDPEEVAEIGMSFCDEKVASRFIGRAIAYNVQFSADSIMELADAVDEATLKSILQHTSAVFSAEQIAVLDGYVDEDTILLLRTDTEEAPILSSGSQTKRQQRKAATLTGSRLGDTILAFEAASLLDKHLFGKKK